MKKIFDLAIVKGDDETPAGISIGINVKLGGKETICPVIDVCSEYLTLEREIQAIKENLDDLLDKSKKVLTGKYPDRGLDLRSDMGPEEIWDTLSSMPEEKDFIEAFNSLEESRRKEVADYILARCNIFSGQGAVFSSRYDNTTSLLVD